ncbi:aldehyde dehydrogenase family protein [Streptomyces caniferus]|uniref:aldehyde dehydrogenase family protein n=1 Tax=Streptomyces caniferus TaxID=285557 RepID=UPI002E2D1A97|nr:aldehyde dehydrogenase family protein [Streptomyces caniferus]
MESLPLDSLYVDGRWTGPAADETIAVENPATEEIVGRVAAGDARDVRRAVDAARAAFPSWAATEAPERAAHLRALRDLLVENQAEMAGLITREMGSPLSFSRRVQVGLPVKVLESYADALAADGEERIGHSLVVREAAGVVAAITPWNYPLHQAVAKLGAALAAGCTLVLKPSELAPLSACFLTTLIDALGLPPGVFNLVPGRGTEAGRALAADPGVDVVSFTGSLAAGREVGSAAALGVKKVCLELGGKSATVVLPDADLETAVTDAAHGALHNAGQTCSARSRLLVPRARLDEALDVVRSVLAAYVPGDPMDPACRLGPLASRAQRDRVLGYLRAAERSGARQVAGPSWDRAPSLGHYVTPSAWTQVPPNSPPAQEEIFGPVLTVHPFDDDADAVAQANATRYGLAATVWSADTGRATAVARRLRAGQVDINDASFNPAAPFGGYRQSGVGRELGRHGIQEFQELKSLQLPS